MNVCSLRNKIHEIHQILFTHKIHILSVNETWLDSSVADSIISVPGYSLYRKDRNLHGGGVCFYVHSDLKVKQHYQINSSLEAVALQVQLTAASRHQPSLVICSVYRPPSSPVTFWNTLSNELDREFEKNEHILILGDFNVDVLQPASPQYNHLRQFCTEHSLRNLVTTPTRPTSRTCLDLALVSNDLPPATASVVPLHGVSDHDLVLVAMSISSIILPPTHHFRYVRKPGLCKIDYDKCNRELGREIRTVHEANGLSNASLDDNVRSWNSVLQNTIDKYSPLKRVVIPHCKKPLPQPWVDENLKRLLEKRRHLHRKVRKNPGNKSFLESYRRIRREGTLLNRRLKSEYCAQKFKELKANPRAQWAMINFLSGRQQLRSPPKASVSDLTTTFAAIVTDVTRPTSIPACTCACDEANAVILKSFPPVEVEEVRCMLEHLSAAKSPGSDSFSPIFLRQCATTLSTSLTSIINESLSSGTVPEDYKLANVCPVYKGGERSDPSNYRPISLLPIVSKLLERIVHRCLVMHLTDPEINGLPPEQFAYRRSHSCEDALTLAISRWTAALDTSHLCGAVFADLSKAFDRVQHSKLIEILHSLGIHGAALNWFISYLSHRKQQVKARDQIGVAYDCTRGVPQGSVLGPILFCVYLRSIPKVFKHSSCQIYADDICFYTVSKDANIICANLTEDINRLHDELTRLGLVLNPQKTKLLVFHRSTLELPRSLCVSCNNTSIPAESSTRYLGIIIDDQLTFKLQVESVCKKVYDKINAFKHGRRNLCRAARRTFYLSIVQSTLEYASNAYCHSLTARLYDKIVTTSHIAMKKVFALDRYTPTDIVYSVARLYPISLRFNLKLYVFVYRCLHELASPLLQNLFSRRSFMSHTAARTRGQTFNMLQLPSAKSRYGYNSVCFLAADRWNSLPQVCREASSLPEFATLTKSHLGYPVKRLRSVGSPLVN